MSEAATPSPKLPDHKQFAKVTTHKWFGGIVGGLAYMFGINVYFLRIGVVAVIIALPNMGVGFAVDIIAIAYLAVWVLGPNWDPEPSDYDARTK